jgi:hypothetical protein
MATWCRREPYGLDDEPVQPNATPAQPEGSDAIEKVKKSAGEPHFHELEPRDQLVAAGRRY